MLNEEEGIGGWGGAEPGSRGSLSRAHTHSSESAGGSFAIPARYVRGCNGDMEEAARRWRETLAWREKEGIDHILLEPQPNFRLIKECYPHALHRHAKSGHPVYYELLGFIDLKRLKASGVTLEETLRYYVFLTEYIWTYVETDQEHGALVSVLDVDNVGIMDLRGDALDFLKAASKVVQQHYVERSHKMFIVNAPGWFSVLWKVIAPLLHENTRRKINIIGRDHQQIQEAIDADSLPTKYGGRDTLPWGSSPEEIRFREYTDALNEGRLEAWFEAERQAGRWQGPAPLPPDPHVVVPAHQAAAATPADAPRPPTLAAMAQGGGGGGGAGSGLNSSGGSSNSNHSSQYTTAQSNWTSSASNSAHSSPTSSSESSPPRSQLLRGRLWAVGQTVLAAPVWGIGAIRNRLFAPVEPPQANLGRENKYVYNADRGEWVLTDADEMSVVDESEERLIRAIQAAHGFVPEGSIGSDFG